MTKGPGERQGKRTERQQRLAEALRANLKRRKAQRQEWTRRSDDVACGRNDGKESG